jgi:hypothetical protein
MNIIRAWEKKPPREAQTSVEAMLRDFKWRRGDPTDPYAIMRDDIVDMCRDAPNLVAAIKWAVRSKRPNGKMHHHQSKLAATLPAWEAVLIMRRGKISTMIDFHWLWLFLKESSIKGIGPLAWYDIGTRIGAYLGLEPNALFIHTGVEQGLRALGVTWPKNQGWMEVRDVDKQIMTKVLRREKADFVEDFLCTYRDAFLMLDG